MNWRNVGIYALPLIASMVIAVSASVAFHLVTPWPFFTGLITSMTLGGLSLYHFPIFKD